MISLEEKFKRHLQRRRFFSKQDTVIVAVSTGVDSMVLLTLLQKLPATMRPHLVVAHVNHELRDQSAVEEQFIRDYCDHHHLQLAVTHWSRSVHPASGVEAAGRAYRYRFFADLMKQRGARVLVTAHHQNDLAETMLMKMVRGGQLDELVGIADQRPFASGQLVRPLCPLPSRTWLIMPGPRGLSGLRTPLTRTSPLPEIVTGTRSFPPSSGKTRVCWTT